MENINIQLYWEKFMDLIIKYGGKFVVAVIIWTVGLFAIKLIIKLVKKGMTRSNVEVTLRKFIISLLNFGLKILLFVTCATIVGIQMTAFITLIGAMGLAFGLAMQGSLANFAGGVLINLLKPYKIGDFIETGGIMGTVKEISIFNTILNTPDNKRIILPNSNVSNNNITNFSAEATRRVDLVFNVDYDTDIEKAKQIIADVIDKHQYTLKDPAPFIRLGNFAASSLDITVRVWGESAHYWDIHFDLMEQVKNAFDEAGIVIPFQQVDVNLKK
ncbi:MAG: mechanosensitive ion channel [Candidatus Stygibacter australis]|nr:mechanosensitive ion channel [Candidatus Stygibacter australis]MDP8323214.1 mechanosensitive ion channel [Candidatus Stygibacter australis]